MMNHLTKISEISNKDTKTTFHTIRNFEGPTSLDNITSAQSHVSPSHYSHTICKRRNRRELRKRTYAPYLIRRLPVQVTNNPFMNHIFNGSPFY